MADDNFSSPAMLAKYRADTPLIGCLGSATVVLTIFGCFRPQTKLRKGYVFTPVCHSVHRGCAACVAVGCMAGAQRAWWGGGGHTWHRMCAWQRGGSCSMRSIEFAGGACMSLSMHGHRRNGMAVVACFYGISGGQCLVGVWIAGGYLYLREYESGSLLGKLALIHGKPLQLT